MPLTRRALVSAIVLGGIAGPASAAAELPRGPVTDLPLPRYVSLKTDRVNLREGPSKDHSTRWVFQRAGLPVEIIAEFETWRRIRDAEGAEGWVLHSLLSGRRTALVMPWAKSETAPVTLFERAADDAEVVARLLPNVIINVRQCTGTWCRVTVISEHNRDLGGFIRQDKLWGVYPNERLD
jgi:SH3-like domain-containing protein